MQPPHYDDRYAHIAQSRFGSGLMASHSAALLRAARSTLTEWIAPVASAHPRVLEVGCNTGGFLEHFRQAYGFEALGSDLNGEALREACTRGHSVAQTDARRLPVASRSVDVIFSQHTLEHVPDLPQALQEFERVLDDRGTAFVIVPLNLWGLETIRVARETLPPSGRSLRAAWRRARQLHCSPLGGPLGGARRHAQRLLHDHKINLTVAGGLRWDLLANLLVFRVQSGAMG